MIIWSVKAAHVLMGSGFAILCVATGIYLLVEPMAEDESDYSKIKKLGGK